MKRPIFRAAAAADIEDAFLWYEGRREGLGNEFLDALRGAMDLVLVHPEAFPVLHRGTRREPVQRRFPYGLYFRVDGDIVLLVACMHVKRHPRR